MATQREQVFRDALELEPADRTELLELLIESLDSLDGDFDEDVEEAWAEEIDKRIAELDSGAVIAEPWDVVRKRLRNDSGG
jgi:putative addiction module component (TIGR02574 family)